MVDAVRDGEASGTVSCEGVVMRVGEGAGAAVVVVGDRGAVDGDRGVEVELEAGDGDRGEVGIAHGACCPEVGGVGSALAALRSGRHGS
jgi:hypothetical protein